MALMGYQPGTLSAEWAYRNAASSGTSAMVSSIAKGLASGIQTGVNLANAMETHERNKMVNDAMRAPITTDLTYEAVKEVPELDKATGRPTGRTTLETETRVAVEKGTPAYLVPQRMAALEAGGKLFKMSADMMDAKRSLASAIDAANIANNPPRPSISIVEKALAMFEGVGKWAASATPTSEAPPAQSKAATVAPPLIQWKRPKGVVIKTAPNYSTLVSGTSGPLTQEKMPWDL